MGIDTKAKRCSALATRRLPWFRRFGPFPDASMTQEDRQQLAFVYRGILAGSHVQVPTFRTVLLTGRDDTTIQLTGRADNVIEDVGD